MAQVIADVYKANMEVVRKGVLPKLYPLSKFVSAKILGNIEKHQITKTPNSADFRAPIETANRAQFGAFSMAGGSLGLGGSFVVNQLVQTTFNVKLGIEITREAAEGTSSAGLSVVNAWKKSLKDAMPLVQNYDDNSFFNITGSQGLIAQSTALDTATYTMEADFGANLIVPGQVVEVLSSALVNKTLAATVSPDDLPYVSYVDRINRTVTLANTAGLTAGNAMASGDYLAFQGVGSTPAWMNGLYYVNDDATSGTYLGITRSTYPEIIANGYSVNGSWTPQASLLVIHRIFLRRGELPEKLKGIMNTAQHAAAMQQGINISYWFRKGGEALIDKMPKVSDMVEICGVPTYLTSKQSQSRVDYVNEADWGRVWFGSKQQWDFYEDQEGRTKFEKRSTNGGVATADLVYLTASYNYYNVNPGAGGFLDALTKPTGY